MVKAEIRNILYNDITYLGMRLVIGAIFIAHSIGKFDPGFAQRLPNMGLPAEMALLIALAEFLPGVFLIMGVLTRISGAVLSALMVGAIFYIHEAKALTGDDGVEFQILLVAASLVLMVAGPGRVSFAQFVQKLPRIIH